VLSVPRPFAAIRTTDQWLRCAFDGTTVERDTGVVHLDWLDPAVVSGGTSGETIPDAGGLAFDADCVLYHAVPDEGRLERTLWAPHDRRLAVDSSIPVQDVVPIPPWPGLPAGDAPAGVFVAASSTPPLRFPRGLAVDDGDRLFVCESDAGRVLVYDPRSYRLLRRAAMGARPLDVVAGGRRVWVLLEGRSGIARFAARGRIAMVPLPPGVLAPGRLTLDAAGDLVILDRARTASARLIPLERPTEAVSVPWATDLELDGDGWIVVARRPRDDFIRVRLRPGGHDEGPPLAARGYDGRGIVRAPDGRIVFWTARGPRVAVAARLVYAKHGRVTSYRLDAGVYGTMWGRIFLDACLPDGTDVRLFAATADEDLDDATLARTPPPRLAATPPPHEDASPPMPPLGLVPASDADGLPLHRRVTGRELPWQQLPVGDPFATYEAPVDAPPGRYLWVTLELRGSTRLTPRVRFVRAEHPSHDWLRRLPRAYSRDAAMADFLRRYLAPIEGLLDDAAGRAEARDVLLHPYGVPDELLPWLAGFVGLVLDERWPAHTRREILAEAVDLFRRRGTVGGLRRFLELYLGVPVAIVEGWQLRGLGGAILGESGPTFTTSVLGGGLRVGASVGAQGEATVGGSLEEAFATHAHRFSVVIPAIVDADAMAVVRHILDVHRPAHTLVDVCAVGAGMGVGRALYVGLSSIVGRSGGWRTARVGSITLGSGAILGRPRTGISPAGTRLGRDSRLG